MPGRTREDLLLAMNRPRAEGAGRCLATGFDDQLTLLEPVGFRRAADRGAIARGDRGKHERWTVPRRLRREHDWPHLIGTFGAVELVGEHVRGFAAARERLYAAVSPRFPSSSEPLN